MFSSDAPDMPPVTRARPTSAPGSASGLPRACRRRIASRPRSAGVDADVAVEAARPQQRRVEHVEAVGRGEHDDALVAAEAVDLDQELVEGGLALARSQP